MTIQMNNKILQAAEASVESRLLPGVRDNYLRVVVMGMRVALKDGEAGILASIRQSADPIKDAAVGAVKLVLMIRKDSRGTMPVNAMVPAAMTLMLQALDFVDKTKTAPIGNEELDRATKIFTDTLFKAMNMDMAKLTKIAAKVHGITQDPTAMEKLGLRAGVLRDPRASQSSGIINGAAVAERSAGEPV